MSLQNLASHVQSAGRGEDKMLVHMTPKEVAGLQTLAAAHGGSLTINPETGLPEAGFLSSLLPTVIGAALAPATGGASLGITSALGTAAVVGGAYGLATGSLKKGLMAGLGAYGGASMMPGIMEAGAAAAPAAMTAPSVVPPTAAVPTPPPATLGSGLTSSAPNILQSPLTGQPVGGTNLLGAPTSATAPAAAAGATFPPAPVRPESIVATGATQGAPSVLAQTGSGIKNILSDPEKLKAFLGDQKYNLLSSAASAMTDYDEEEKKKGTASGIPLSAYSYAPRYAPSARAAGSTAERTYFAAEGGVASLNPVENMSQQNAMMDNSRYPMAFQNTSTYASPAERPVSQNVIYPPTDADVTPYSGTLRMASGGIASLASGGRTIKGGIADARSEIASRTKDYQAFTANKSKERAAVSNEAKKRLSDLKSEYENRINKYKAETTAELAARNKSVSAERDARIKEFNATTQNELKERTNNVNNEYNQRIKDFNNDTQRELKERQKAINAEKDTAAKKQMQADLSAWQKDRASGLKSLQTDFQKAKNDVSSWQKSRGAELQGIQKEYNDQLSGKSGYAKERADGLTALQSEYKKATDETTAKQKADIAAIDTELANQKKEYNANLNLLKGYAASGVTGYEGGIKGTDLTSLNKAYDTEIGVQKGELAKAEQLLAAAKASGVPSAIERAQKYYDEEKADFDAANKGKEEGISQFKESTKRTGSLGTRGQYTTTTGDVDAIKKEIDEIKKNPAQTSAWGPSSLSKEQQNRINELQAKLAGMSAAEKVYNPATGQYEIPEGAKFQKLAKAPAFGTAKKIMEEEDINSMFEYMAGRRPTEAEMAKYLGKSMTETQLAQQIGAVAELGAAAKFTDDDLNAQAQYYWGRNMTKGELAWYKDPANKISNFNQLRNAMTNSAAFLDNVNKINQAAFQKQQAAAQIAAEGPATLEQISSTYQDILGKPPTAEEIASARNSGATASQLAQQLKSSPAYQAKMTQPFVPPVQTPAVTPISQEQINQYRQAYMAPTAPTSAQPALAPLFQTGGAGGYTFTPPQQEAAIAGALPYTDVINRLGIGGVYSQIAQKAPELQPGLRFGLPETYRPIAQPATQPMADGGITALAAGGNMDLGDYSDGGRLLKGPGDGVSDSIPASIGGRRPARLADGEFVIPARIVSELGNGSTEAGARQLYAMMDRVQKRRRKSVGKGKVAVDSKASQLLPA